MLFVNDSKATNADAAGKALASFTDIYWIIGGRPKEGGLAGLEPFFPKIARAYLIGEAADAFAAPARRRSVDHVHCGTLDRAVEAAAADAERSIGQRAGRAAVARLRLLRPVRQFREARRSASAQIVMGLDGAESVKPEQGRAA